MWCQNAAVADDGQLAVAALKCPSTITLRLQRRLLQQRLG